MMDKSSRSSSVASDLDEIETSSSKSNDINRPKVNSNSKTISEPEKGSVSHSKRNETKEPEISQLVDNMQRLESTINSLRESTATQIMQLEEMLTHKNKIISDLEEKLDQQRDYEEIKRELTYVRTELSHFGPLQTLETGNADPKALELLLLEKSKSLQGDSFKLESVNEASSQAQQLMQQQQQPQQRHPFFNPFTLPQLQGLGNVESFGSLLGEEIANSYAKAIAKRDSSFLAMAAAAAANSANSGKLVSSNSANANNSGNNLNDSLSPSQISNCDEAIEDKSSGSLSASTTPTSAMICSESADPITHSPLGATLAERGLVPSNYSPISQNPSASASYDKLQQQLRCNVEKYMNETLNTLQISRCVRELLSMHNIGQRLFAKYVLGLSQGTVIAEERIAHILNEAQRSMKGINRADFFSSPFINGDHLTHSKMDRDLKRDCPDNVSENGSERDDKSEIAGNDRKSPASSLNATALATINNFYRNFNETGNINERSRVSKSKPEGNDLMNSPDIMRLYQDQLAKLIGQHIEEGFRNTQNYDEARNAINFYNQELSRMNPFAAQASSNPELLARLFSSGLLNGAGYLGGLPLSLDSLQQANQLDSIRKNAQLDSPQPHDTREISSNNSIESRSKLDILNQIKNEPSSPSHNGSLIGSNGGNGDTGRGNSSVLSNGDITAAEDLVASPLQRMQSITNSLLSQSSLPSLPTQSSRPAKAVLPPITQQQFDQYNNLNTEDIVKRVKEQLSQYSISQRLFGESVLGLSQGSVSDLLARPKPWHMLTQKGREPFIRMKMFLEDENAIHKLVASQYKIAPEKLMRTGSFVAGTGMPNISMTPNVVPQIPTPPSSLSLNSTSMSKNSHFKTSMNEPIIKYEQSLSPSSIENSARSNTSTPEPGMTTPTSASSPLTVRQRVAPYAAALNHNLLRPSLTQSASYMQPSVYELAALTSDLDTQIITTRIKETLMAHNIGQKIFGEVVLGLSQGSVSELLSKPKPWHMLSIKGREPFIRMQLWLNDPNNIEKLQTLKNERREANKRRRTHMDDGIGFKALDSQLFNFSNNFGLNAPSLSKSLIGSTGPYQPSSANSQPAAKKARILFTEEQKEALRIAFAMDPYPSSTTAEFLAKELNLSIRTITNWFHNHRMRLKQINTSNGEESNQTTLPYSVGRDSVSFDQSHFRDLLQQRLANLKLSASTVGNSNNSSNGSSHSGSNHYGSFGPNSASSPQHPFKYSSSMFQTQSVYSNNTNSCSSPGSSSPFHEEEEDMGTLDLSMSSHNQQLRHPESDKLDSTGRSSVQDDSDDGCRSGDEEEIENNQFDDDNRKISVDLSEKRFMGSSRRKPQHVMSSSSRRKAAQPQQWVAPVNPICYEGEDDYAEDDYEDDREPSEEFDSNLKRSSEHTNGGGKGKDGSKRISTHDDDQKTDEEVELEPNGADSDTDHEISVAPYKKLKSSTSVMSKLAISDDNSNIMQECVQ
ncbi:hypothetical protein RDWZM_008144 [Blomia tropicalis]|uniref:Homeobox protein cut-like n=1 Tax=Blomia tropicalis TaxID=40697 RepID=A0A9Q0M300_BLOTA|nr:hypothetical protein RDWZM_008144 [Blomia tropicalis]